MDGFDAFNATWTISKAYRFILEVIKGLFSVIFEHWLFFVPMFLILLLSVMGFVMWLIMESAQYAGGSVYANPNRQFGRLANPNRQYETKMPFWLGLIFNQIRKHERAVKEAEKQKQLNDRLEQRAQEKAARELKADVREAQRKHREEMRAFTDSLNYEKAEIYFSNNPNAIKINIDGKTFWREGWENHNAQMRLATDSVNQEKADEYFKNNPNAFKISIDGKTFWRDGWENHRWDKDGRVRHTIHFKREGDKYIPTGESHSMTEYEDPD